MPKEERIKYIRSQHPNFSDGDLRSYLRDMGF